MTFYAEDKEHSIFISSGHVKLAGLLYVPQNAEGIVLFAHGSGSSRHSARNKYVANILNEANLATLLFDLLTPAEETIDLNTQQFRFDIPFLASRLIDVTSWCLKQLSTYHLKIGYFGASTGGGAALVAAAKESNTVSAVVSRGGRPDLAGGFLPYVKAPTLLIVGGNDEVVIEMNQTALTQMNCFTQLEIIPGATHLFEEAGTLPQVADLAKTWFIDYLSLAST